MAPDTVVLFATIVLLLPMGYFLLAAPAFLLVKLDIRPVALLLRGMFNGYFLTLIAAGCVAALTFALARRPAPIFAVGLIAAFAFFARRWFLKRMDVEISARDASDPDAARRLRRLHWWGMLSNAVQVVAILASIPHIVVSSA